jgi:hemoglobin-like flavoprotein
VNAAQQELVQTAFARPAVNLALREALLWTLEQALGEDLTPAVREAWTVCYDELAGEMKTAAGV